MTRALVGLIGLACAACGEAGVVFRVEGSLDPQVTSVAMTIVASSDAGERCRTSWSVGPGSLPYDLAVTRGETYGAAVVLDVQVLSGETPRLRRVVWVAFEDDLLDETVELQESCLDVTCDGDEQCVDGGCDPIAPQATGDWRGLSDCEP